MVKINCYTYKIVLYSPKIIKTTHKTTFKKPLNLQKGKVSTNTIKKHSEDTKAPLDNNIKVIDNVTKGYI